MPSVPPVPPSVLRGFVVDVFVAGGTSQRDAETMSRLLVEADMCQKDDHPGSHGTRCMTDYGSEGGNAGWQNYVRRMGPSPPSPYSGNSGSGTGRVNPRPQVTVVSQSPTARVYDGDGGMGHIVCSEATDWAIAAAKEFGTAAATTRNHFHVGATGFYSRIAARQGCICICMSSHRAMLPSDTDSSHPPRSIDDYSHDPSANIFMNCVSKNAKLGIVYQNDTKTRNFALKMMNSAGRNDIRGSVISSPMAIGIPAGAEDPLVLDMATGFASPEAPGIFKNLGLQAAVVTLGGVFAGIYQAELLPGATEYEANQGSTIMVLDASKFMPQEEYQHSMDRFIGEAKALGPIEGLQEQAECESHSLASLCGVHVHISSGLPPRWVFSWQAVPGGDQARRIRQCEANGIAMEEHHLASLVA